MKYKNRRTGLIIEINGNLSGGEWEKVKEPTKKRKSKDVKKK